MRNWNLLGFWCIILLIAACVYTFLACGSKGNVDNSTVSSVNLHQYMGKWYEIARFDHRFERGMTHCTATYSLKKDGKVKVINEGKKGGKWKMSEGKAKTTKEPGVLRVSFFGPFYSDYRIMMLGEDYSYALVGGDSGDYLWILSRTPQLEQSVIDRIIEEANYRGYETNKLIWVDQRGM